MKWPKILVVMAGAIIITTLGIDAADTWRGSQSTLLASLIGSNKKSFCPTGMIYIPSGLTFSCVDEFEAVAGENCPFKNPENSIETTANINNPRCLPTITKDTYPWRFISRDQAMVACSRAGKRLPKAEEWYQSALGTVPENCNLNSKSYTVVGNNSSCVSAIGIAEAVGNVWEWVSDDIINGQYNGRSLPASGYVTQVDSAGVATETSATVINDQFNKNYFWSEAIGSYGMIRGGFYSSGEDGGVFSIQAITKPTFSGTAIGFRCVL